MVVLWLLQYLTEEQCFNVCIKCDFAAEIPSWLGFIQSGLN